MVVARRRMITLEEFLALPEEEPALEYADGEVTQKRSPSYRHGRLQFVVTALVTSTQAPSSFSAASAAASADFSSGRPSRRRRDCSSCSISPAT